MTRIDILALLLTLLAVGGSHAAAGAPDCNDNGVPDGIDIIVGTSLDCDGNGVPDECQPDCNGNGLMDLCEVDDGLADDCNGNLVPDDCDVAELDCNGNSVPDDCDVADGTSLDCNWNFAPDECDLVDGTSPDCNANAVPDECEPECNDNGIPDECDLASGFSDDCNASGVPDECEADLAFEEEALVQSAGLIYSVDAADLDGDGDRDVLAADTTRGEIVWLENLDGAGSFGVPQRIADGLDFPTETIAADLDGDGDIDVAAAIHGEPDGLVWFENTSGKGHFGAVHVVATDIPGAFSLFAADIDGDGDPDLVSGGTEGFQVEWHENVDGAGSFDERHLIGNVTGLVRSVFAADLDGDGDADVLAAAHTEDRIIRFDNVNGNGVFGPAVDLATGFNAPADVIGADVDADGDVDVLWTSWYGGTFWHRNLDGAGTFTPPQSVPRSGRAVAATDLDRDGDLDLVVTRTGTYWFEYLEAQGVFGPANLVATDTGIAVWAGDLDADLDPDLVISKEYSAVDLDLYRLSTGDCDLNGVPDECDIDGGALADCTGNGTPDVCEPDCNGNGAGDSCDILTGASTDCTLNGVPDDCEPDCNGNGVADSCDVDAGTSLDCDANGIPDECEADCNGNGVEDSCDIDAGTSLDCDGSGTPDECDPDCDGDGVPDRCEDDCDGDGVPDNCEIAVGTASDCDADGVPDNCATEVAFEPVGLSSIGLPHSVHAGDIDGDGDVDAVSSTDLRIVWYPNEGGGTIGSSQTISTANALTVWAVDLDGDGDVDILGNSSANPLWIENLDGAGTFAEREFISVDPEDSATVYPADLDGDGDLDVAEASNDANTLSWHENLGGASFVRHVIGNPLYPVSVLARDFDGDGDLDLLCGSVNDQTLAWYENLDGLGSFGPERTIQVGPSSLYYLEAADMDGDGDVDVLAPYWGSQGTLQLFRNLDGSGNFGAPEFIADRPGGAGTMAVDLDVDGDLDIVSNAAFPSSDNVTSTVWFENLDGGAHFGPPRDIFHHPRFENDLYVADIDGDGDLDVLSNNFDDNDVRWLRNLSGDCDGNGVPDVCDPDCNVNGIADECDLARASSVDCNANDVPDECDTACSDACDADADGCLDDLDCAPSDATLWATPGAARGLTLAGMTTLTWQTPERPGADSVRYDTLRSPDTDDFFGPATCVETDETDRTAEDPFVPEPGELACYLVRVENACPADDGSMGADSAGNARAGRVCP